MRNVGTYEKVLAFSISFLFGVFSLFYLVFFASAKSSIADAQERLNEAKLFGITNTISWEKELDHKKDNLDFFSSFGKIKATKDFSAQIQDEIDQVTQNILKEKKAELTQETNNLSEKLLIYDSFNIENKEDFYQEVNNASKILTNETATIKEIDKSISNLIIQNSLLEEKAQEIKKELLIESVKNSLNDALILKTFFKSFKGYDTELKSISTYEKQVNELLKSEALSTISFNELKSKLETDIYPFIEAPITKKSEVDLEMKAKREEWIKDEKEKRERYGLGDAPKPPKDADKVIYVNLKSQTLYAYDKDELILSTPITSGRNGFETAKGDFKIYTKTTNKRLISPFTTDKESPLYYDLLVQYWMPFFEGYGIHDAYWRSSFGGSDYHWNGSHGCLNTPLTAVKFLWDWAEIGTTVYVE